MHRAIPTFAAAAVALASLAGVAHGGTATAATAATAPTIAIPVVTAKIDPGTKRFTITVRCLTADADCEGVLDTRTAAKVKPYPSQPAAIAKVGTFPFRIAAGATAKVTGRVYGPALAQAMLAGKVRLSLVGRALGATDPLGTKVVTFTYKRV